MPAGGASIALWIACAILLAFVRFLMSQLRATKGSRELVTTRTQFRDDSGGSFISSSRKIFSS